ncbi:hypothetical protein L7750_17725 [Xenorhabdus bovienii]|uniref:hypothetical protein n=1 Tax=Xenorhabdus bovienii TaxID=40576 RepID=UPI001EDCD329|nr:hypothetical protein [Xenorhabdus bovienii]MCG3472152.1 hypothetical protein [Xenorhabdus bovienii]
MTELEKPLLSALKRMKQQVSFLNNRVFAPLLSTPCWRRALRKKRYTAATSLVPPSCDSPNTSANFAVFPPLNFLVFVMLNTILFALSQKQFFCMQ